MSFTFLALYLSTDLKSSTDDISSPLDQNSSENGDLCDSFSELSTLDGEEISDEMLIENRCFQEIETQKEFNKEIDDHSLDLQDTNVVVSSFLTDFSEASIDLQKQTRLYQLMINNSQVGWSKLNVETNISVLTLLLFEWIEGLKQPVLRRDNFEDIVIHYKQPEICFQKFPPVSF